MSTVVFSIILLAFMSLVVSARQQETNRESRLPEGLPSRPPWEPRRVSIPAKPQKPEREGQPEGAMHESGTDPSLHLEGEGLSGGEGEWAGEGPGLQNQSSTETTSGPLNSAAVTYPSTIGDSILVGGYSGKELVQGVIWAEILNRPRGLRHFRGPRQ